MSPRKDPNFWPCGHPRTAQNTCSVGVAGLRCMTCRMVINAAWVARNRDQFNAYQRAYRAKRRAAKSAEGRS